MPLKLRIALAAATALLLTACAGSPPGEPSKAISTAAGLPLTKDALLVMEKRANEAWKSKDEKFWQSFLSDKFVGYGTSGKLDKATAAKYFNGAECENKSYAMSGEQMTQLDPDVALLTYKFTVDGQCGGQKVPAESMVAGIYVREGDEWKAAFYADAPIVDPKATSATPAMSAKPGAAKLDTDTEHLLAAETAVWEAWKDGDRTRIEALVSSEMSFINIFGTRFLSKAEAVKDWTSHGCKVKSVSVTNPMATRLSPNVAVLTFSAGADGTCFGQKVGPIWGTSVYVKNGEQWKWNFGINLPAH